MAIMLVALAICLSACSESKDAAPSGSEQSPEQVQGTVPAQEATARQDAPQREEADGAAPSQPQQTGGGNDHGEVPSDQGAQVENVSGESSDGTSTDESPAAQNADPEPDGADGGEEADPAQEPDIILPTEKDADGEQDTDNAEVNFNDL